MSAKHGAGFPGRRARGAPGGMAVSCGGDLARGAVCFDPRHPLY